MRPSLLTTGYDLERLANVQRLLAQCNAQKTGAAHHALALYSWLQADALHKNRHHLPLHQKAQVFQQLPHLGICSLIAIVGARS